jgi:NADH:ubiquinone oxidoreductase subunit 5 (subunit L)/multisubunit Na+/H+ antiporter MnhA subunit
MLGPSPVSALLHSAAMVAMGGYLLLRLHPLLAATGWAATTAAWIGAGTALALGAVAVGQSDLKQLLAASTSAQLGFVIVGAATGGVAGGTAHLIAHAATKALLFLAAGAWLSALGTRELLALRGAGRRYRVVGATFSLGAVGLAGVPPLALWASKDEVFAAARHFSPALYVVCLAATVLSAAYAGKALGLVLRPLPPDPEAGYDTERHGLRHVGRWQRAPLVVLAAGAAGLGILVLPPGGDAFRRLLGATGEPTATGWEMAVSGTLAVASVVVAAALADRLPSPAWARTWLGLGAVADRLVVRPVLALAHGLARIDDRGLDRAVEATAAGAVRLSGSAERVDNAGVDGAVAAVAAGVRRLGALARRPQTGQVHQYYAQAVVGLLAAVLLLLIVVR